MGIEQSVPETSHTLSPDWPGLSSQGLEVQFSGSLFGLAVIWFPRVQASPLGAVPVWSAFPSYMTATWPNFPITTVSHSGGSLWLAPDLFQIGSKRERFEEHLWRHNCSWHYFLSPCDLHLDPHARPANRAAAHNSGTRAAAAAKPPDRYRPPSQ